MEPHSISLSVSIVRTIRHACHDIDINCDTGRGDQNRSDLVRPSTVLVPAARFISFAGIARYGFTAVPAGAGAAGARRGGGLATLQRRNRSPWPPRALSEIYLFHHHHGKARAASELRDFDQVSSKSSLITMIRYTLLMHTDEVGLQR